MIRIKNLTVRNFMSVGNATQAINFENNDLTLVLGVDLDQGGDDAGARNGTGKSTIINALSYAFYDTGISSIRKDNLVNDVNNKNMVVTVEFLVNGKEYRIERGRKPNFLRFFVDNIEDEAQGENKETLAKIEEAIGMSHGLFCHIVTLNTDTIPFLKESAAKQRAIIEELLGITLLSKKALRLKEKIKETKKSIEAEEFNIKAIIDANKKIKEQIDSLVSRQKIWQRKKQETIDGFESDIAALTKIDINEELENFKKLKEYIEWEKRVNELESEIAQSDAELERAQRQQDLSLENLEKALDNTCPTCNQTINDESHAGILEGLKVAKSDAVDYHETVKARRKELVDEVFDMPNLGSKPTTFYNNEDDAREHQNTLNFLVKQLEEKQKEEDPFQEQIDEMKESGIEEVSYDYLNELADELDHQEFLEKLLVNKDSFIRKKIIDQNLFFLNQRLHYYLEQIKLPHKVRFMNDLGVEIIKLGRYKDFGNLSKGEKNRLMLSLSWAFRDVWENLYHPINLMFIDEVIDSGMDGAGVEASMSILKKLTRERGKSLWLISHRDELASRVNNVLQVTKENDFTTYGNDVTIM